MRFRPLAFVIAMSLAFGLANAARAAIIVDNVTPSNATAPGWTYGTGYTDAKGADLLYANGAGSFVDGLYTSPTLPLGTYDVYIYYYNFGSGLSAKLTTAGSFQVFGDTGILGTVWGSNPSYTFSYMDTASNVTGFSVDFRHVTGGPESYFDAIGYELVPEPASVSLLAAAGVLVFGRRKQPARR